MAQANSIFTPKPIPRTINSRVGLGTFVKMMTASVGIKACGGCRRRAKKLDKLIPNINPFS
jgi:uncharacterized membrane protein YcjF (UPF0283 family)